MWHGHAWSSNSTREGCSIEHGRPWQQCIILRMYCGCKSVYKVPSVTPSLCANTQWIGQSTRCPSGHGSWLGYAEMYQNKKDHIRHEYATFANKIARVPTYGHCTHDGTKKLWTVIHLVVGNRIPVQVDQTHKRHPHFMRGGGRASIKWQLINIGSHEKVQYFASINFVVGLLFFNLF